MVQCDKCGVDDDLPFRCNYCGGYFCSEHRLPEFHECTGLYNQRPIPNWRNGARGPARDYVYKVPRNHSNVRSLLRFSEKEVQHLGISLIIIAALPIMSWNFLLQSPTLALGAVLIFAAAFLLHELAHKFMAQRLGYWAEFRLNNIGLLITLMSFFSNFKIVAPGAVMITGLMYGNDYGKISVAGPVTNIAQAILFLALDLFTTNPVLSVLAYVGILINSSLALFNLLPFGVFDGVKIIRWNWKVWLATAATAGILYFYIL